MIEHVFRLKKNDLLKESILDYCLKNNIDAGIVVSSVGCLQNANIRNATASKIVNINKDLEIISLNGTVSKNRIHLHISASDSDLLCYGGHLENGCKVNTTSEVVILELESYEFDKEFDAETGYNELKINKKIKDLLEK